MQFREVGKTGMNASVIGFGGEHVDNQPREVVEEVVNAVIDNGINMIDIFMPGEAVRTNFGHALAGRRDKVLLQGAIGSVDLENQYDISRDLEICKTYFENLLRFLKTDYIDFGMLFFMDTHEDVDAMINNGVVEYAMTLKKEGKIRAIGATAHNPDTAKRLVREGMIETLMFSINPAFDMMPGTGDIAKMMENSFTSQVTRIDPERAELYRLCESKGVGLTVMKTFGAGKLLSPEHTPFTEALTPAQCIHYALTRPAVASVMLGCKSRQEVEAAMKYLEASDAEKDYSRAISSFREDGKGGFPGSCVYCNHCQPCPSEIDIAAVNKYLDIARLNESAIPPSIQQHYRSLKAHGSDCVECGSCENRCPFSVPVISNMHDAARLFGE